MSELIEAEFAYPKKRKKDVDLYVGMVRDAVGVNGERHLVRVAAIKSINFKADQVIVTIDVEVIYTLPLI